MSKPAPTVTVYLVNHNYCQYLRQSVESVLFQTYEDFELIIIDDGSTDNSRSIIEQYSGDPRITIIFQKNKGLNVTNNIALRAARGRLILRLDADDWLDPHALEVMAGYLERNPDVALVFPDWFLVDDSGTVIELVRRHNFSKVEMLDQPAHGACTMVRRSCLMGLDGYDEAFRCQDGWDIWVRLIRHHKVANINLPLFFYRQHARSLTRNESHLLQTRAQILAREIRRDGKSQTAIGIIPVRGGGFDKASIALEKLGSRTVLDWTIEAALESERVRTLAVSSPDEPVLAHVRRHYPGRVIAIQRPTALAEPNTEIETTITHGLKEVAAIGSAPSHQIVVVLYVECPFRTPQLIDMAVDTLTVFDADTVVGVRPENDMFYRHQGNGLEPIRATVGLRLEREEMFRSAAKVYCARRVWFERERRITGGRVGHVVVDEFAALKIQSEWDFEVARFLAERLESERRDAMAKAEV